jgi:cytochrome P450
MDDERCPVEDWARDYDLFDPRFVADPYPIWQDLRAACPVAHSDRWGGSWMPTRYEDVVAIAHDTARFSSKDVGLAPFEAWVVCHGCRRSPPTLRTTPGTGG